ncbi:MAG: hypothetical protein JJV88_05500 [Sulfurovum sp.]|nr:hypothetical protein [Sulfurovaceae bacterium]
MSEINTKVDTKDDTKKNLNFRQLHTPIKFIIRRDLTEEIRFEIAYQAYQAQQSENSYGEIVKLVKEYQISRSFIYVLLNVLKGFISHVFSPKEQEKQIDKKEIISKMLMLRMVGGSSIQAISSLMKYDDLNYSSVGSISQNLWAIGKMLPTVQSIPMDDKIEVTAVSDEIFIGNQPILITAEPRSSAILAIELAKDRTKDTWTEHITKIELSGKVEIIYMVTDEGSGLRWAISDKNILWQPDTYHAIAHRLGKWVHILEARAYKRIAIEYERKRVISSAKTQKIINKRRYNYSKSRKNSIEAIELYEDFLYLYANLIKEIQPFHSDGKIRDRDSARANIEVALELIKSLENSHINSQIKSIEKILPELLNYFERTKIAIEKCKKLGISDENITNLTLVWQWKKALVKAKKEERRERAKLEWLFYQEYAKDSLGESYEEVSKLIFDELDNIVQASSIIENINSILRPYLDKSKNQITQESLNLFAFYHNHRRYNAGKRKGKTPMEMLINKKQNKDWVELLTDFIEDVQPSFFL